MHNLQGKKTNLERAEGESIQYIVSRTDEDSYTRELVAELWS